MDQNFIFALLKRYLLKNLSQHNLIGVGCEHPVVNVFCHQRADIKFKSFEKDIFFCVIRVIVDEKLICRVKSIFEHLDDESKTDIVHILFERNQV